MSTPPDLPDPLVAQDGPPPIDPDGGGATTVTAFGAGAKGAGEEAADPVVTSNLAGLRVGPRDEPVKIVDDGDKPGEEGSAVEGARAGLADLVPDDLGSIGLDDLASGEEDAEDDSGSLDGLDRPPQQEPDLAGGKGGGESSFSGGGGGGGGQQGQLLDDFASRGQPREDYAPGDFGADPDQPPSGGNRSVESGSDGTTGIVTFDNAERVGHFVRDSNGNTTDGYWVDKQTAQEFEFHASYDDEGNLVVESAKNLSDGTTQVHNAVTGETTTLHPDGSTSSTSKADASTPAGDTEVVLTPEEQQELRDSIDALGQHRGDQGRETQPTEGDEAFGAGAPKSEISFARRPGRGRHGGPAG